MWHLQGPGGIWQGENRHCIFMCVCCRGWVSVTERSTEATVTAEIVQTGEVFWSLQGFSGWPSSGQWNIMAAIAFLQKWSTGVATRGKREGDTRKTCCASSAHPHPAAARKTSQATAMWIGCIVKASAAQRCTEATGRYNKDWTERFRGWISVCTYLQSVEC